MARPLLCYAMRAAVYLRVSKEGCRCGHGRDKHGDDGRCRRCLCATYQGKQDEANQEPDCLRVCAARSWEPVIYREQASAVKRRPQWQAVLDAAHRGEVGAVVVWALDRAGRNRVQLSHDLGELVRKGATVVSVREPWLDQPAGPVRDLLIQLFAWFAESERLRLIDRTKAGQATAAARGVQIGRPRVPPDRVERMFQAWEVGDSAFRAAKRLGIPEGTVRTYFRRWLNHPRKPPRPVSS